MVPGCDAFSGYGLIDFNLARQSGIRFVWLKCQEGNKGRDPAFLRNLARARDAGVAVGAYSFAFPLPHGPGLPSGRSALEQARLFYDACAGLGSQPGELSPALDLEWPPPNEWAKWGCSAQQISDWGRECCEAMALLWGRLPVIYTYPWFWTALSKADVSWAARYPLWMAHYTHPDAGIPEGKSPVVPAPWSDWVAWQYSADGSKERIPGVPACPVDRDVIRDEETFKRLLGYVESDPDADTQPELVPQMRPDPIQARTVVPFDIVHPKVPIGRDDDDDGGPQAA